MAGARVGGSTPASHIKGGFVRSRRASDRRTGWKVEHHGGAVPACYRGVMNAATRLATYGTLAPGQPNHHQLAGLNGRWRTGSVRGDLVAEGWGAELGYPALVLDPNGQPLEVHVFESDDLPDHWPRLDAFEGEGYRRVIADVETSDGTVEAWIHVTAR